MPPHIPFSSMTTLFQTIIDALKSFFRNWGKGVIIKGRNCKSKIELKKILLNVINELGFFKLSNDHFCLPNDHFCLHNDHFSLSNDHFCLPNAHFCPPKEHFCPPNDHFCLPEEHFCPPIGHFCWLNGHFCLLNIECVDPLVSS